MDVEQSFVCVGWLIVTYINHIPSSTIIHLLKQNQNCGNKNGSKKNMKMSTCPCPLVHFWFLMKNLMKNEFFVVKFWCFLEISLSLQPRRLRERAAPRQFKRAWLLSACTVRAIRFTTTKKMKLRNATHNSLNMRGLINLPLVIAESVL